VARRKDWGQPGMSGDHLDSELWLIELSEIVDECEANERPDVSRLLRKLHTLFAIAPGQWRAQFEPVPDISEFTALLDSEAFESAAIRLLGSKSGYMLSRSAGGEALASIWMETNPEEVHAKASSEAIALVKAFAMAVFFSLGKTASLGGGSSLGSA